PWVAAGFGKAGEPLPKPLPQPLLQAHAVTDLPPLPFDQLAAAGASDDQLARAAAATHPILAPAGGRAGRPPPPPGVGGGAPGLATGAPVARPDDGRDSSRTPRLGRGRPARHGAARHHRST